MRPLVADLMGDPKESAKLMRPEYAFIGVASNSGSGRLVVLLSTPAVDLDRFSRDIFLLVNIAREEAGIAPVAWSFNAGPARLALGGFVEYGRGTYDTYNQFARSNVHGDGEADHAGGGILAKIEAPAGPGTFHAEISGRMGRMHNEFSSSDLRSQAGVAASFALSSSYHGAHLGLGYVFNLSESASLDLYGRYLWTRQEGNAAALSTGEAVRFEDADSSRIKAGARVSARLGDAVSVFAGAAWEREMDGEARAFINDLPIEAPSSRGDTAVGELGFSIKPGSGPLKLDLALEGHAGKRRGVSGSLMATFEF